jgi:hypothetical protein
MSIVMLGEAAHRVQSSKLIDAPVAEDDTMRGDDPQQTALFSYISPEARVPQALRCAPFGRWSMSC